MPSGVALAAMCIVGVELVLLLDLRRHMGATVRLSREALATVRSPVLTEAEKERVARRNSLALMRETLLFALKFLGVAAGLYGVYLAAVHWAGVPHDGLNTRLLSPLVWVLMTVFAIVYLRVRHVVTQRL